MLKRIVHALSVLSFVLLSVTPVLSAAKPDTNRDRLSALRAVEEVLWKHRIWPESNPGEKPALEEVLSEEALQQRSDDGRRKAVALEAWQQAPLGHDEVQAEIDRIFRETRDPGMLEEIVEALGSNPELVAETIARPSLADRLLRGRYARDPMFHVETRARAEAALAAHGTPAEMKDLGGAYTEATWVLLSESETGDSLEPGAILMDAATWSHEIWTLASLLGVERPGRRKNTRPNFESVKELADDLPIQLVSPLQETDDAFYVVAILSSERGRLRVANVQWSKESFDAWWKQASESFPVADTVSEANFILPSALSQACADDTWESLSGPVGVAARYEHVSLWTGSEMIVWGGYNSSSGYLANGALYSPLLNTWTVMSASPLSTRARATIVWTGTEAWIWGGFGNGGSRGDGAAFNPSNPSDPATWNLLSGMNAPSARSDHVAVWTGSSMLVWGGAGTVTLNDGKKLSAGVGQPWVDLPLPGLGTPGRTAAMAVWTGSRMVVWGGVDATGASTDTGGLFDPVTGTWSETAIPAGLEGRRYHTSVWTGSEMIVWGGVQSSGDRLGNGGLYNPVTNTWTLTQSTEAPSARGNHSAVWTGSEMVVWGGFSSQLENTGGRYNPLIDCWDAMTTVSAPAARILPGAVWTTNGLTRMLLWGGLDPPGPTYFHDLEAYCASRAQVAGTLTGDTTWTTEMSPVLLTGDVIVPAGVTLTIEPGVEVHAWHTLGAGNSSPRIELIVSGSLVANGTTADPIHFDGARCGSGAQPGDWYGIRLLSGSTASFSHVTIDHAQDALTLSGVSPTLTEVTLRNLTGSGISGATGPSAPLLVDGLTISTAGVYGLASISVPGQSSWKRLTIENAASGAGTINAGGAGTRIVGAVIRNNTGATGGLSLSSSGGLIEIINSQIYGNTGMGLTLGGSGHRTLANNEVYSNGSGISATSTGAVGTLFTLNRCSIHGNGSVDLTLGAGSLPPDARLTYWDPVSRAQMLVSPPLCPIDIPRILDINDPPQFTRPALDFSGFLSASPVIGDDLRSYLTIPLAVPRHSPVRITGAVVSTAGIAPGGRVDVCVDDLATPSDDCVGPANWLPATVTGSFFRIDRSLAPGSYTVKVRATDSLGAISNDTQPLQVLPTRTVSGTLAASECWGPDEDVSLEGDLTVPSGVILTLLPGTRVRTACLSDYTRSGLDPSRIEITVGGIFRTLGSDPNWVTIRSSRTTPLKGDWQGIRYLNTTTYAPQVPTDPHSTIRYTILEDAVDTITLEAAAVDVLNSRIRNASSDGIVTTSLPGAKPLWRINDNLIELNGGRGIDLRANVAIEAIGNTVRLNGGQGVYLDSSIYPVTVRSLTAESNSGPGVFLRSSNNAVTVTDTTITGNGGAGLEISANQNVARLDRSVISANLGTGITVSDANEFYLLNSIVTGNVRGLRVITPRLIAAYSTVEGNLDPADQGSGFRYESGWSSIPGEPAVIGMSTIANPLPFDPSKPDIYLFRSSGAMGRSVNARRNWWGTGGTAHLDSLASDGIQPDNAEFIRDVRDGSDSTLGFVDFSNWMTSEPPASLRPPLVSRAAHVTYPADGATLSAYSFLITGVAYASAGIDHIELSITAAPGSETWQTGVIGKEAWQVDWFPSGPGTWYVKARVCDAQAICSVPDPADVVGVTIIHSGPTTTGTINPSPGSLIETWPAGVVTLTGDIVVPVGHTLQISQGTSVQATSLGDDRFGGLDPARVEIIVEGTLIAEGVLASPVVITSNRTGGGVPGDWKGLRFEDSSDDICEAGGGNCNRLDWTTVDSGWDGIEMRGAIARLTEVSSEGNLLSGLRIWDSNFTWEPSPPCMLSSGGMQPCFVATGGSFSNNGARGISFDGGSPGSLHWQFNDLLIAGNGGDGIGGALLPSASTFLFSGVTVSGNAGSGIVAVGNYPSLVLRHSVIDGNGAWGANLSATLVEAFDNDISNHPTDGYAALQSTATTAMLSKNRFAGNRQNLKLSGPGAVLAYNYLSPTTSTSLANVAVSYGSATADRARIHFNNLPAAASNLLLRAEHTQGIPANANFWGSAATALMSNPATPYPTDIDPYLYDIEESGGYGRIDYRNWLVAPLDLSGTHHSGFVEPVDGATIPPGSITLSGAAAAANGVDRVEVRINNGINIGPWEVATGTLYWTYTWSNATASATQYTLQVKVVDRMGNEQAVPTEIKVTVAISALCNRVVSGVLQADDTWCGTNMRMSGDVTVPSDKTLTILPGTVVSAFRLADDQNGGADSSRTELIVAGTLRFVDPDNPGVVPSPNNRITFTSNAPAGTKASGDWYGLRFTPTADATLEYLTVEYGVYGILGDTNAYPDLLNSIIQHTSYGCVALKPGNGSAGPVRSSLWVTGNTITDCGAPGLDLAYSPAAMGWSGFAITVSGNTVTCSGPVMSGLSLLWAGNGPSGPISLSGNVISNCPTSRSGIQLFGYGSLLGTLSIEDNDLINNFYGIYGSGISGSGVTQGVIRGNTIQGTYGYVNSLSGSWRIDENTLTGTGSGGVGLTVGRGQVLRNEISGFTGSAITSLFSNQVDDVFLYNDIHDNPGDAFNIDAFYGSTVAAHWNRIHNNATGGSAQTIRNTVGAWQDLRSNYWGAPVGAEMVAGGEDLVDIGSIHDIEDQDTLGRVDYSGYIVPPPSPWSAPTVSEARFIAPANGAQLSLATIQLAGTGFSPDPNVAFTVQVDVSVNGGPFTAVSGVTGKYRWNASYTPTVDGNYTFRACVNDGACQSPWAMTTVTVDRALPTVAGELLHDEVWPTTSPVLLTGDVIVPYGKTLTLPPGTILEAARLSDSLHGGLDKSRIEIIVEGSLRLIDPNNPGVVPSPNNRITFTSNAPAGTKASGDWYGLRFTPTADATLKYLTVEYGVYGILGDTNAYPDLLNSIIQHTSYGCVVLKPGDGSAGPVRSSLWVTGNTITDCGAPGLDLAYSPAAMGWSGFAITVSGNTVTCSGPVMSGLSLLWGGNGPSGPVSLSGNVISNCPTFRSGIQLFGYGSLLGTLSIEDNNLINNFYGIYGSGISGSGVTQGVIRGNTIQGTYGYVNSLSGSWRIDENKLTGTGSGGVGLTVGRGQVLRNEISGFTGSAITSLFSNQVDDVFLYNDIHDNPGDAFNIDAFYGTTIAAHWNRIHNNATGGSAQTIRNTVGAWQDLRSNYWGAPVGAEMVAEGYPSNIGDAGQTGGILDIEDNEALGRVDYSGYDSLPPSPWSAPTVSEARFIAPANGAQLSLATIQLAGTGFSPDPNVAFTVQVEVSVNGGPFTAVSGVTGKYRWNASYTPTVDGDYTFRACVNDGACQIPWAMTTVNANHSRSVSSGTLPSNQTWGPGVVPIYGDIVVPAGTTLTLLPGTEVRAAALSDDTHGGVDRSRIELIVQGKLIANGSAGNRIRLTTASATPAQGQWYGVRYLGLPDSADLLRGADLSWGVTGVSNLIDSFSGSGRYPDLIDTTIDQMSQRAVTFTGVGGSAVKPAWNLSGLTISNIGADGLWMSLTTGAPLSINVDRLTLSSFGAFTYGKGLYLDGTPSAGTTFSVRDSDISVSGAHDLVFIYTSDLSVDMRSTTLRNAAQQGTLLSYTGTSLTMRENRLSGGSVGALVQQYYASGSAMVDIRRTQITGTSATGLYLNTGSAGSWSVHDSIITDNSGDGVYIQGGLGVSLTGNDLYGNGQVATNCVNCAVETASSPSTLVHQAGNNWWGIGVTSEMASKSCTGDIDSIADRQDTSTVALVDFCSAPTGTYAAAAFGHQAENLAFSFVSGGGGALQLVWTPWFGISYDLIVGNLSALSQGSGFVNLGPVTCLAQQNVTGTIADTSGTPPLGTGWFYLVRDHSSPGAYGYASNGNVEVPASGGCP